MDMKKETCEETCYTLEASGDSEADSYLSKGEHVYEDFTADDDAESCSYDGSDICDAAELNEYNEKKDNSLYGTSYCEDDDDEMQEHHYKSCVSDDSSQELLDEAEKNRLFWEACLAS
ncbi:hypothetical protein Lal_00017395 [Lupinus albus]|nr:hypothetical protein Lal_00017395 [Lupinus albus]